MKKILALFGIGIFALVLLIVGRQPDYFQSKFHKSPKEHRPVYLGVWVGGFWDNGTKTLNISKATDFEEAIDTKMAITNIYSEWAYLPNEDLVNNLNDISANGWTPMISANPYFFEGCPDTGMSLYKTIADGDCDEFLKAAAVNLRSFEKPIFFRFAWEMNLPDMYWSVQRLNSDPKDFVAAWQHMHTIFKDNNADNVLWVLSFNTSHPKTTPYKQLFPGDAYIDWVAIDGYNWGNSHSWSGWASFSGVFTNSYKELTALTKKPVMLSEVNSAPTGGDKAAWLHDMLSEQIPRHFPQIRAIIFFNENKSDGESVDWRMEKSDEYTKVLQEDLRKPLYKKFFP